MVVVGRGSSSPVNRLVAMVPYLAADSVLSRDARTMMADTPSAISDVSRADMVKAWHADSQSPAAKTVVGNCNSIRNKLSVKNYRKFLQTIDVNKICQL